MRNRIIFLHGYGVRGDFWRDFAPRFENDFDEVLTPDLAMQDLPTLIDTTSILVRRAAERDGGGAVRTSLVGHSLGAAVAGVVASSLGGDLVARVVLISPPFGEQHTPMRALTRFLLRYRLIPGFLVRGRFYSTHTPVGVQKAMFARAVPESRTLQDAIFASRWFHTDLLAGRLPQPSLVICSEADAIVRAADSLELAKRIGAETCVYDRARQVAHDDFVASPVISLDAANVVRRFLLDDHGLV